MTDNLGERSIPSDHVAILCCHTETIGSWRRWQADPELEVETSRLLHLFEQIRDDHQYPDDPFAALADFKLIIEKAKKTDPS